MQMLYALSLLDYSNGKSVLIYHNMNWCWVIKVLSGTDTVFLNSDFVELIEGSWMIET